MSNSNKRYTEEFKMEAVKPITQIDEQTYTSPINSNYLKARFDSFE